jgi:peptide/nickel transport system substrate-binding protein
MRKKALLSIAMVAIGAGLLVAAAFAGQAKSSSPQSSKAKAGGTFKVNLSTTDVLYTDPSLEYESTGWQIEYATALKLVNWKETKPILFPEAAATFPRVSRGGRVFTFTIRKGLKLSDGSAVTARSFKWAFDRAVNKKMAAAGAAGFLKDFSSARTKGKYTLVITLKVPRPDFPSIVSMPFFQAMNPSKMKIDPSGVNVYPSGGPYYIASRVNNRSILLKRNKFYKGNRPHNVSQVSIAVNTDINTSLLEVKSGAKDYDMFGPPPSQTADLAKNYKKQFHINAGVVTDYLAMNTTYGSAGEGIKNHSCFNGYSGVGVRTRKAVNYALNRPQILAARGFAAGTAAKQLLPPTMPGYHNWNKQIPYPLGRPNVSKAKSLKPKQCKVVFYASTSPVSTLIVQIVKANLGAIGISTDIKQYAFDVRVKKEGHRGEPFDLDLQAWGSDYPDPVDFVDILLDGRNIISENNLNTSYFNNKTFNKRMQAASKITNTAIRYPAFAAIDRDVMTQQAPLASLFFRNVREFVSKRVGGYSYQPVYANMNFNTVYFK